MKYQLWGKHIPYPDYGRNPVLHSLTNKESVYSIVFWSSCSSFNTSNEIVVPFVVSSHEHSNSNGAMLDLSFFCSEIIISSRSCYNYIVNCIIINAISEVIIFGWHLSHPLLTFQLIRNSHAVSGWDHVWVSYVRALMFSFSLFFNPETWLTKLSGKLV